MHLASPTDTAGCLPILRPIVVAFGGWWSQNFRSRRSDSSACSKSSHKLSKLTNSTGRKKQKLSSGDSTCQLATTDTMAAETTYIYGQGAGPDTVVEGKRGSLGDSENELGRIDNGIKVKYEVTLDFTEPDETTRAQNLHYENSKRA